MRESQTHHFVGLDIGTSTVRCVIGMVDADSLMPSIIGYGAAPNIGMRRGVVVHPEEVTQAITAAVTDAERISGIKIQNATVNVNGAHVSGLDSRGVIAISSANREITSEDRLRVEEAATIVQLPPNREIIQVFAKNYRVDGQDNIKDPLGMRGVRLEVDTHIVTASTPNVRSLEMALEGANILAGHRTVTSLAAAEAVLNRSQKESGTLLLDIGAGTTNLVVIEDGEVQHVAVVPMGGIHITNDLAIGLKIDLELAEMVKTKHASLTEKSRRLRPSVLYENTTHHFDGEEIYMIVEARVEEILDYVDKELKHIQKSRKLPGGVVVVGGSAKLPGLAEYTREKLQLAARLGHLQPVSGMIDKIDDASFISTIGLMLLDMLLSGQHHPRDQGQPEPGFFGFVNGLLVKLKRK